MEVCNTHSTKHYLDKHHRTVSIWRLFTQKGTQNKNTTKKKHTQKTQQKRHISICVNSIGSMYSI